MHRYIARIVTKDASSDNRIQVGLESPGYILTSSDGGQSWMIRAGPGSRWWTAVTLSSDGTYGVVMAKDSSIYTSSDFGNTFTRIDSTALNDEVRTQIQWTSLDSSSTGNFVVAASSPGYIYVSNNFGKTWYRKQGSGGRSWRSVECKYQNCKEIWATSDSSLCGSTDYGSTWKC